MKNIGKRIAAILVIAITVAAAVALPVFADGEPAAAADPVSSKAYAAAITVGLVAAAGAIAMALAIRKAMEAMARQPEVEGKIRTGMMLGLVFIETAIIYALIVAILIIFVL